jgi:hypothetical protein
MKLSQVAALLALMATFDYRKTDQTDDEAWFHVVGDLDFEDAKTAVFEHYKTSDERMKPVDVRRRVAAIRDERGRRQGAPVGAGGTMEIPDADPDDVAAYVAAVREGRTRAHDRLTARPVAALLASRPFQDVPPVCAAEVRREVRALEGRSR